MTEIIRYSRLGKEDLRFGFGTFEVRLADGRVVTLSEIDIGAILNDAALSTQVLALVTLTLANLTVTSSVNISGATFTAGALNLSGGQIAFPAAQSASSGVNTLDDYEEGDWTPSVGGTATYTAQFGHYVKVGRMVFITCTLIINTIGTGSQTVISGLPFTCSRDAALAPGDVSGLSQSIVSLHPQVGTSTASISLRSMTAAGAATALNTLLTSGTSVIVGGGYMTST